MRTNENEVRILVAEDNDEDVFLVRRALDKHLGRYHLIVASDGEEALRLLERVNADAAVPCPDFVVLDLNLPDCRGIRVLERLRKIPRCAATPVIVFTSSDSPQDKAEAFRMGADGFFHKPTDVASFTKLGEMIRQILPTLSQGE